MFIKESVRFLSNAALNEQGISICVNYDNLFRLLITYVINCGFVCILSLHQ